MKEGFNFRSIFRPCSNSPDRHFSGVKHKMLPPDESKVETLCVSVAWPNINMNQYATFSVEYLLGRFMYLLLVTDSTQVPVAASGQELLITGPGAEDEGQCCIS